MLSQRSFDSVRIFFFFFLLKKKKKIPIRVGGQIGVRIKKKKKCFFAKKGEKRKREGEGQERNDLKKQNKRKREILAFPHRCHKLIDLHLCKKDIARTKRKKKS